MNELFSSVLIQALYYGLWGAFCIFAVGAIQRGFFLTYLRVRTSFGKFVMVKIRGSLRDYFAKGWVEEGFLVYKIKKGFRDYVTIRINIPKDENPFYRCMSVAWVDVDDEKHAICKPNYSVVDGFDAESNDHLHRRAIMKPAESSNYEKFMLIGLFIVGVIAIAAAYFAFKSNANVEVLIQNLPAMLKNMAGTVVGGKTI